MSTSAAARRRIMDVCLLLESDLTYEHTAESLADYAGLSVYHFQRTFKQVVGESLMAHLRRLRLARAAYVLKNSAATITQIALEIGFETHAGFTHAFTKAYGKAPLEFRNDNHVRAYLPIASEGPYNADQPALAGCPLSVRIEKQPTRRLALMRYIGPTSGMPAFWTKMTDWCKQRDLLNPESELLGIHHDDWDEDTPDDYEHYRYDAAIVVNSDFVPDEVVNCTFLPGGETAVVSFRGSLKELDTAWRTFVYHWLPASGYVPRLSTVFDIYSPQIFIGSRLGRLIRSLKGIDATLCIPVSRMPIPIGAPD